MKGLSFDMKTRALNTGIFFGIRFITVGILGFLLSLGSGISQYLVPPFRR